MISKIKSEKKINLMHFQAESIFEKHIAPQYQTHTKNMITP
jgi:hypothetical protein